MSIKLWTAGAVLAWASAAPVQAAIVNYSQELLFNAASQSFWGPGGSAASFSSSRMLGSDWLGVSYSVAASTGTVSGAYAGAISGRYVDAVPTGGVWSGVFSFGGQAGEQLQSIIGAKINVTAHALNGDVCILCQDYSLQATLATGPALDQTTRASDTLTFASPGVGADIKIGSVKAGVDLNVVEKLSFTPLAVSSVLRATDRFGREVSENVYFDINGAPIRVDMALPARGEWTFDFTDFKLVNLFDNDFLLNVNPFVQYTIGVRCGDPGTNTDNGWFCAGDDKASFTVAGVSLYNGNPFELSFSSPDALAFTVRQAPEPGVLALLMGALGIGAVLRRRG